MPATERHSNVENRRGKKEEYFLIVNGLEEHTIWIAPGSQKNVFFFDEGKAKMCKIILMEEVGLPGECVIFEHGNVQDAGGGCKVKLSIRHNLYLIFEDVDSKGTVTFAYGDSMQRDIVNKGEVPLGDMDLFYLSDDKKCADDNMSKITVTA